MDPRKNPYAPGAGTTPPELAGREELIENALIELDRCRNGLSARSLIFVGLRGAGKTVLLNRLLREAESRKLITVAIETPESRSLPSVLIPALRKALLQFDVKFRTEELGKKVFGLLGSFANAMKMKYQDIEFGLDLGSEPGADSGDLEHDLMTLLLELGNAAKKKHTALVFFIDEIQYIPEQQFAALIMALHRCIQNQSPVILLGAGLPQLVGQAGRAKSYAERLFQYPNIGPLNENAAYQALEAPAKIQHVEFEKSALREIFHQTQGYPYFLQEWGKHAWNCASASPIKLEDVQTATQVALAELDVNFFRVRFDRLTPNEKKYLRAIAALPNQSHIRSGDVATLLKKHVQTVAPVRASLIRKGMIYSPSHGDIQFTVPLFSSYLKRVIPAL